MRNLSRLLIILTTLSLFSACGDAGDAKKTDPNETENQTHNEQDPEKKKKKKDDVGKDEKNKNEKDEVKVGNAKDGDPCENEKACSSKTKLHCVKKNSNDTKGTCVKACDTDAGACGSILKCDEKPSFSGAETNVKVCVDPPKTVTPKCETTKLESAWPMHKESAYNKNSATVTSNENFTQVVLAAGKISRNQQEKAFHYFDFKNKTTVPLGDVKALTTNTAWDIGIRGFAVITNGGQYPGDIVITKLTEKDSVNFEKVTKEDVAQSIFKEEEPFDESCDPITVGFLPIVNNATSQLNSDVGGFNTYYWFDYNLGEHMPDPRPSEFYVLKSESKGWMIKFQIINSEKDSNKNITYTFKYAMM